MSRGQPSTLSNAEVTRRSRRPLVLGLAALTVAVEVGSYANVVPSVEISHLRISTSIVPGLALALACGGRLLGRSTTRRASAAYWLAIIVVLSGLAVGFAGLHGSGAVPGLVVAAFDEELVYRLAVPAVVALLLRQARVPDQRARLAGFVVAGLWFVLLPGHRVQMATPTEALPFLAFATLSAVLVYRSGSILPMAVAHAATNLMTILMWNEVLPKDARSAMLGSILVLLALAYGRPRHLVHGDCGHIVDVRTGRIVEIDLRTPEPAQAERRVPTLGSPALVVD